MASAVTHCHFSPNAARSNQVVSIDVMNFDTYTIGVQIHHNKAIDNLNGIVIM